MCTSLEFSEGQSVGGQVQTIVCWWPKPVWKGSQTQVGRGLWGILAEKLFHTGTHQYISSNNCQKFMALFLIVSAVILINWLIERKGKSPISIDNILKWKLQQSIFLKPAKPFMPLYWISSKAHDACAQKVYLHYSPLCVYYWSMIDVLLYFTTIATHLAFWMANLPLSHQCIMQRPFQLAL